MNAFRFPDGFFWGAATSSHQVEGNNVHNDWWAWEQAGRVKEPSGLACDQYHRFAEDFDLAASLGHNAHRFSIEWSRVEPQPGRFDDAALAHYVEVIDALRSRGLEPVVTLHHYTNPQWMARAGTWTNPQIVDWFARYTERVAKAVGNRVRYWITINEPMVYVHMSYLEGIGPPGMRSVRAAQRVTEHLIRAHAAAYHVLHAAARTDAPPPQVSVANYLPLFLPCRAWWPPHRVASALTDRIFNGGFMTAVTEGRWAVPGVFPKRIAEAKGTLDYLGLNFYRRHFIRIGARPSQWLGMACERAHHWGPMTERTSWMGWEVYPEAFSEVLTRWSRLGLPILVTENGTSMADDARRWSFIHQHLAAMSRAIEAGTRVLGYLYWSLLDNFEWAHGFAPRFGLIEVDYATQERRVRESARRYAEVCRTNRLLVDSQTP